jgi:chromate reductase
VIGASTGVFGAVWAQAELRKVLGLAGALVLDRELPVALAKDSIDEDGRLADAGQVAALAELLAELVEAARAAGRGSPRDRAHDGLRADRRAA